MTARRFPGLRVAAYAASYGGLAAATQIAPQLLALFQLGPDDYGRFSILYLIFAWSLSLMLSIVSEPHARRISVPSGGHQPTAVDGADAYLGMATLIALAAGLVGAAVAGVLWRDWLSALLGGLAVLLAAFRGGARYREVLSGGWKGARAGDGAALAVFLVTGFLLHDRTEDAVGLLAAWAAGSLATLLVASRVTRPTTALVREWTRVHHHTIKPLLKDSVVLDLVSIGAPFVVAPFLGYTDFGIYRAVSSAAAPIRVVLEAVRPLASRADTPASRRRWLGLSVILGAASGLAAASGILVVDRLGIEAGVFTYLTPYAWWTGAFAGVSVVGAIAYYLARVHATARQLWRGRLLQSGSALVFPLLGAAFGGLDAAIYCYVFGTLIGALVWAFMIVRDTGTSATGH